MTEVFIDLENAYSKGVSLKSLTLRRYLDLAPVLGLAAAVDDEDPVWFTADGDGWQDMLGYLRELALNPAAIFIAHNAAFDIRDLRYGRTPSGPLDIPQPLRVRCSLEMACAAWPNQPGGYGLESLGKTLNLGLAKTGKGSNVGRMTPDELAAYCCNDVSMCRAIYRRAAVHLPPCELRLAEAANRVRALHFNVSADKVDAALTEFGHVAADEVREALKVLGEDGDEAFGWDAEGRVKSVSPAALRTLLLDNLGFDTVSTSKKKINPEKLRLNPAAQEVVNRVSGVNKALHVMRKTRVFHGSEVADVELGYFRAHTGRYSSPSTGKGLNLHNLGKRNKRMAKITRTMFTIQDGYCLVRGDFANVEYRVGGLLYDCEHITKLFTADILADPYSAFWFYAVGQTVTKADPARQVAKQAVLQLEYLAGLENWCGVLQMALTDPEFKVSVADLAAICAAQGWHPPTSPYARRAMTKLRAPWEVVAVAEKTRELFHRIHPEFRAKTKWLENAVHSASRAMNKSDGDRMLDIAYSQPAALDRNKVDVQWSGRFEGASVRVRCGNWPAETVTWRDLGIRAVGQDGGACLTGMNGRKGYWPLRSTAIIENVCQSAARNALCQAKLALEERGYQHILSVHDEIMLVVPKTREAVLRANQDLLDLVGPGRLPGWGWSALVNPDEVTVTKTLWEVEPGQLLPPVGEKDGKPIYPKNHVWWDRLAAGEASLLENLP